MATYEIKEGSEGYLGSNKYLTITINGIYDQYVELEESEYKEVNDVMELVESNSKVNQRLQSLADEWEEKN